MTTGFSVFVNIGGKVNPSLAAAVAATKAQVTGLGASLASIGQRGSQHFASMTRAVDATAKRFEKLQQKGRDATLAITAPVGLAARSGASTVYGFEKELNKVQAYGELSDIERKRIEDNAREMARLGLAGAKDAVELQRRYVQAGRSVDQTIGMTKPTLNFSLYGDVAPAKAADVITSIAAAYQKPMETLEQASQVATRIGDVLAKGANISRADVSDFAEGFKYVAPLAHAAGMGIEQVAAAIATMNQNGLKGNEAGVALRSMLVRMVKPTANARAAIEGMGLSFEQFVNKWQKLDGNGLRGVLALNGIDVKKPLMDKVVGAVKDMDPQTQAKEIRETVTKMLVEGMSLKARDGKVVAKTISNFLGNLASEVDADALIRALEEKGVSLGRIANLFDVRQGARLSTLFSGSLYQDLLKQVMDEKTNGGSARGAETMLQGIVGAVLRFQGAWDNLWISIARSGVLDVVTSMLERIAKAMDDLGKSSPANLKLGVGLLAAAAAAGPLLFVLGAIGRVGAFAFKSVATGLALLFAPIRLAAVGIVALARGIVAAGAAALLLGGRLRAVMAAMAMLRFSTIALAGVSALGAGLAAAGAAVLRFPIVALRAIGAALIFNPVGIVITAIVTALTALGVWVANNWEGMKSFFAGFGEGFMKGFGPEAGAAVSKIADGLSSVYRYISDLLGPLDASKAKWSEWGQTMGGAVAAGVNAVINGIKSLIGFLGSVIEKASAVGEAIRGMFAASPGGGSAARLPAGSPGAKVFGKRALGGPVGMGKPYLVGERGPEIFVPGQTGRIETNNTLRGLTSNGATAVAGASSNTTNNTRSQRAQVTVNVQGGDPDAVGRAAEDAVYRVFARLESEQRGLLSD